MESPMGIPLKLLNCIHCIFLMASITKRVTLHTSYTLLKNMLRLGKHNGVPEKSSIMDLPPFCKQFVSSNKYRVAAINPEF
jgi:hypothetical protein